MLGSVGLESSSIDNVAGENVFRKTITTIQLAWFATQSLGRAVTGLAFSLAEVTTLSFLTCAIITMILWWEKPGGVSTRVRLRLPAVTQQAVEKMLQSTKSEREYLVRDLWVSSIDTSNGNREFTLRESVLVLASAALFSPGAGAWHMAA